MVQPVMEGAEPFHLETSQSEVQVSLSFNFPPFKKSSPAKTASKAQLADMFTLQFINPQTKSLEYAKRPVRVATGSSGGDY